MFKLLNKLIYLKTYGIIPVLLFMSLMTILSGIILIFSTVPDDYIQGSLVKIMYIHVPCSWLVVFLYCVLGVCSIVYVVKNIVMFDLIVKCSVKPLLIICGVSIITGAIWGKPAWGTWWVWDARLVSMLLLFSILLSYVTLRNVYKNEYIASKLSSLLMIFGVINIPIIKFSVNIWSTLHQPSSILRYGGPSIHTSMLHPLIIMFIGMLVFLLCIIAINIKTELYSRKLYRYYIRHLR